MTGDLTELDGLIWSDRDEGRPQPYRRPVRLEMRPEDSLYYGIEKGSMLPIKALEVRRTLEAVRRVCLWKSPEHLLDDEDWPAGI